MRYVFPAIFALLCATCAEPTSSRGGSAGGAGGASSGAETSAGGNTSAGAGSGASGGTATGTGTSTGTAAGGSAASTPTNSSLTVTLDGAPQKSMGYGLYAFSYGIQTYSFDTCTFGADHNETMTPKSAQEIMMLLPPPGSTGTTQFTPSTTTGPMMPLERGPYVVTTAQCERALYRVKSGSMTVTSLSGTASSTVIEGTLDATFTGGTPEKTLKVQGSFKAPANLCAASVAGKGGDSCPLPALLKSYGLVLHPY